MDEHGTVVAAQAYRRYGHYLAGPHAVDLDPDVARRLRASATVDGAAALSRMGELRRRLATEIGDAFLVCPTVRTPPPALNDVRRSESAYDSINAEVLRTTMVLSYLGMPGISLPMVGGRARGVGVLLSARRGRDAAVLEVAEKVERISLDLNLS
jgi:aspartyl-tRNA(Asn)/glutamyl-tRNA(Gln) amidotransferase subunit A